MTGELPVGFSLSLTDIITYNQPNFLMNSLPCRAFWVISNETGIVVPGYTNCKVLWLLNGAPSNEMAIQGSQPINDWIDQLVKHQVCNPEVTGSNPFLAINIFALVNDNIFTPLHLLDYFISFVLSNFNIFIVDCSN